MTSRTRLFLAVGVAFLIGVGSGVGGAIGMSRMVTGKPLFLAANTGATPAQSATTGTPSPSPLTAPPPSSSRPTPAPSPASGTGPSTRYAAGGTFDQARGNFVLFGGQPTPGDYAGGTTFLDETWTWDASGWKLLHPAHSPSSRSHPALVYDAARGVVLLQGGYVGNGPISDTWSWDGSDWKQLVPPGVLNVGPGFPNAAYDPVRKSVLMQPESGPCPCTYTTSLWNWDGANWTKLTTTGPRPLAAGGEGPYFAMAYLPTIKSAVVYGNLQSGPATWVVDGANNWTQVNTTTGTASASYSMALDERRGVIVLIGNLGDAWTFDGTKWTAIASVSGVPAGGSVTAFDSARGLIIHFGGSAHDMWTWDGARWTRAG